MLFTVSTIRDTVTNVERFVAGNLAGGVDHLLVFLDAPRVPDQQETRAFLLKHANVTVVETDDTWWRVRRPRPLNVRQRINANAAKVALADVDDATWLFHVDGDEIVDVDRAVLDAVPPEVDSVTLEVLETAAVAHPDGEPTLFKRLLGPADLGLLSALGVLERPVNADYFHGHIDGKGGLRRGAEGWLALHKVVDAAREPLPTFTDPALRVLHYESWSGDDFVRKWAAMVRSGPMARFRAGRDEVASAIRTLVGKDLPDDVRRRLLIDLFERHVADDVDTLRDLGLLVEIDPRQGTHRPARLRSRARKTLAARLAELAEAPKRPLLGPLSVQRDDDDSDDADDDTD